METKPLIILTGPTAVGKTSIRSGLQKRWTERLYPRIPCRYTGDMDIGSAKIQPGRNERE